MFNTINSTIIDILGIGHLSPEKQTDSMEKYGSIVYQETILRCLEMMTEEQKAEFESLISTSPSPETIFTFLAEKIPSVGDIAREEAEKLRSENGEIGK